MASVPPRMPERRRGNVRALVASMVADYIAPPRRIAYRDPSGSGAWVSQCGGVSVFESIYQAAAAPGVVVSGAIECGQVYASLAAHLPIGHRAATVIVNLRKR